MIQSGKNFKIGRTVDMGRRLKEIQTGESKTSILIHSITTDDPPGIEGYWHRRFADKRVNGEWFKLESADVSAFKRRVYQ